MRNPSQATLGLHAAMDGQQVNIRMPAIVPVSAIIPTRNRSLSLRKMLESLAQQSVQPDEMIVVDASPSDDTARLCTASVPELSTRVMYQQAVEVGAAVQRNQGMAYASHGMILFLDDDIIFERDCLKQLLAALEYDARIGGVNAMITNQRYTSPGLVSRGLFRFLNGHPESSYAGKCIGPALNLLPEDHPDLPEIVPVEWLNTTCTLYRREALPTPLFPKHFTGYSLMEDVTLSLMVGRTWKLANARTARIFHDSQRGEHKDDTAVVAKMELVNRYYVMTSVLGRRRAGDYFKLIVLQVFGMVTPLVSMKGWKSLPGVLLGNLKGFQEILCGHMQAAARRV